MSENSVPILVVHKGNQDYLHICLKQAHYSNPNSRIILLGDESNQNCLPFVEWYNIFDYYKEASVFEGIYRHFSCNPLEYERFALAKWFAINEFMKEKQIEKILIMDSDVLVFTDFEKDEAHNLAMKKYDFTVSTHGGQETMFFNSQNALQGFCDYIMGIFKDDEIMKELTRISNHPDFCIAAEGKEETNNEDSLYMKSWDFKVAPLSDMTALCWYLNDNPNLNYFDYCYDIDNKVVNMSMDFRAFLRAGALVAVVYKNKLPFAYDMWLNKFVQLHTMHFQGWKKELMANYATYDKDENFSQPVFTEKQICKIYGIEKKEEQEAKQKPKSFIFKLFNRKK